MASYEYESYTPNPLPPIDPDLSYENIVMPDPEDSNYCRVYRGCPSSSYITDDTPYERIPNIIPTIGPTENIIEKQKLRENMWSIKR